MRTSCLCCSHNHMNRRVSPVTGVSRAVVAAVDAAPGVRVALVGVSVTEARPAGGEAPVARQAAVTLPTVRSREARALSGQLIAEGTLRALRVAVTHCRRTNHKHFLLNTLQIVLEVVPLRGRYKYL